VPAYQQPQDVTLGTLLPMPFQAQRPSWWLPNGKRPVRRGTVMIYQDIPGTEEKQRYASTSTQ